MKDNLINLSNIKIEEIYEIYKSSSNGLSSIQVEKLEEKHGKNKVLKEKKQSTFKKFMLTFKDPLIILLLFLSIVSFFTKDYTAMYIIISMVFLGVFITFFQEIKADNAAEELAKMVSVTATVFRDNKEFEVPLSDVVPGDIVKLSAGDMIPADIRLINAKDLFVNQSSLTGESNPVEKFTTIDSSISNALELKNICFLGSDVISGTAIGIVLKTGTNTFFGSIAKSITQKEPITPFDKGIKDFTWLMIRIIIIMAPLVLIINGVLKQDWLSAFLFAMAVTVGLTPEMMPMIVSVNLSKGAINMSKKKVIVKKLKSIQNFGAMDVLCTDKTGTITQGKIILEKHLDIEGNTSSKVLEYAYLNSYYNTGLKNMTDDAILDHKENKDLKLLLNKYQKIDEIPFDFVRKKMSVVIENKEGSNILICKGSFEEIMKSCTKVETNNKITKINDLDLSEVKNMIRDFNNEGFREIALAYKVMKDAPDIPVYEIKDESELILLGFLFFFDPPKESAKEALERINKLGVDLKILTGDNEMVTEYICSQVGFKTKNILIGSEIETMTDEELYIASNNTNIFARLSPNQKERIIKSLQANDHTVGFLGDGINDAPALRASDIGISVDTAVDIAKESSNIILLDNNLLVLEAGILEGRKVFANITKYIKMAASSNFGNMFAVLGASLFLPFLPMLPIQVLVNNILYDLSQIAIPTDNVDKEWLFKPRKWEMNNIKKYILLFGPLSSIFDFILFFILMNFYNVSNNPSLFHTAWFIESVITQTIIIHIIRTKKIPFIESKPSKPLLFSSIAIIIFAIYLLYSPIKGTLGFVLLPTSYWFVLGGIVLSYLVVTQIAKSWFNKHIDKEDYVR